MWRRTLQYGQHKRTGKLERTKTRARGEWASRRRGEKGVAGEDNNGSWKGGWVELEGAKAVADAELDSGTKRKQQGRHSATVGMEGGEKTMKTQGRVNGGAPVGRGGVSSVHKTVTKAN